jgi:two-component system response regulator
VKTILLVEDSPDDELLALRALKKGAIQNRVVVVHDGVEALDYLFAQGAFAGRDPEDLPEVVLLDLRLPKLDGLEVLRSLRAHERTRSLPVVVLTTSDEESDIVASYNLGANSYIQKPVDFNQFIKAVQCLGLYWLALNAAPPSR